MVTPRSLGPRYPNVLGTFARLLEDRFSRPRGWLRVTPAFALGQDVRSYKDPRTFTVVFAAADAFAGCSVKIVVTPGRGEPSARRE